MTRLRLRLRNHKTPARAGPAAPVRPDSVTQGSRSADPAVARARLDAVAHSERLAALGMARAQADAQAAARADTSVYSVRRWRAAVAGLPFADRPGALSGQQGGARRQALSPHMQDCVEALLYEHGPHLTAPHVVRVLATRHGAAPSLRSVQRCLGDLKVTGARALSAVSDPDGHRSRRAPAFGSRAAGADAPNMVWELDSTPADVMCSDGRHTLVGAIDVWPRRGRVLVVASSRATAICALLRACMIAWGVPETVRTDEGRDYTSRHLSRVLADLGVDHDICPPTRRRRSPLSRGFSAR